MKKFFYAVAALTLALAVSCEREQAPVNPAEGAPAEVSFTLKTGIGTKADPSDGSLVNKLRVAVVDVTDVQNPEFVSSASKVTEAIDRNADGTFTYTATLIKGQTYRFVFWADKDLTYGFDADATSATVTVIDNANAASNDPGRDAFKLVVTKQLTAEGIEESLVLKRAVAQINVAASDYDAAVAVKPDLAFAGSTVKVSAPGSLDLLTNEPGDNVEYEFSATAPVDGTFTLSNTQSSYQWIAMNYVLAGAQKNYSISVAVKATVAGAEKTFVDATIDNVPLQQNYRTNLVGALYTAAVNFNITLDPAILTLDPPIEIAETALADVPAANAALIENIADETITNYTIDEVKVSESTIIIPSGLAASELNFVINSFEALPSGSPVLAIQDEAAANIPYSGDITVTVPADANLDEIVINVPNAHVVLTNGTYTKIIAATSGSTLVIASDVTATTVEIRRGNVELAGSVKDIVRGANNPDELTYVTLVEGYTWTNQAANTAEGTKVVVKDDEPSEDPSEDPGEASFNKVTSISAGDYLIVYEGTPAVALNSAIETIDVASNTIAVEIVDGAIAASAEAKAAAVKFEAIEGGFAIKAANGNYISGKSGSNAIVEGEAAALNTVTFDESGNAIITSNTSFIQYNSTSGQERFRYYKSGTTTQKPVALYKLVGDSDVPVVDPSVDPSEDTSEDPSEDPSEDASEDPIETGATIADLKALITANNTVFETPVTLGAVVVTAINGNQAYLEDASGAIILYLSGHGLEVGKSYTGAVVNGGTFYNTLYEITTFDKTNVTEAEATLPLTNITVADLSSNFKEIESRRVKVSGLSVVAAVPGEKKTLDVKQGEDATKLYALYNQSYAAETVLDVIGQISYYGGAPQIVAIAESDVTVVSTGKQTPTISMPGVLSLQVGNTGSAAATCTSDGQIVYSSSNAEVASVAADGTVTAVAEGRATITASVAATDNFIAVSATCSVTVTAAGTTVEYESVTLDFTAQGYANGDAVTSLTVDPVTATFDQGSNSNNAPKYYTSGTSVRCYGGNTITLSSEKNIAKVEFTFATGEGANELIFDSGAFEANVWEGSATSLLITVGGTSGHRRVQQMVVTYEK